MKVATRTRGRPTVFDNDAVHKLEQAFAIGCTVEEACSISGVSRSAYYKKLEEDSYFMDKMERAKLFMIIQARHTVCNAIRAGDIKTSMWFLERKRKDEFGVKILSVVDTDDQLENYSDKELHALQLL
ncbi:MAG: hypothetical protein AAB395_03680 [Patescibacteria group bacterium]